jgi:hypothetical protein
MFLAVGPTVARAGFIGSSVTGTVESPFGGLVLSGPLTATVGPGVEFNFTGFATADVGDASITLSRTAGPGIAFVLSSSGFHFTFTGAPAITGVTRDPGGTMVAPGITFDADEIFLDFGTKVIGDPRVAES